MFTKVFGLLTLQSMGFALSWSKSVMLWDAPLGGCSGCSVVTETAASVMHHSTAGFPSLVPLALLDSS